MSQAPYFWPNPATPDGLPYVGRDGERNPEIRRISDRDGLRDLISASETLALAYYLKGDGRGIRKALDWLLPFARGKEWPYPQITPWAPSDLLPLLREAAVQYHDRAYEELIAKLSGIPPDEGLELLHPAGRR